MIGRWSDARTLGRCSIVLKSSEARLFTGGVASPHDALTTYLLFIAISNVPVAFAPTDGDLHLTRVMVTRVRPQGDGPTSWTPGRRSTAGRVLPPMNLAESLFQAWAAHIAELPLEAMQHDFGGGMYKHLCLFQQNVIAHGLRDNSLSDSVDVHERIATCLPQPLYPSHAMHSCFRRGLPSRTLCLALHTRLTGFALTAIRKSQST